MNEAEAKRAAGRIFAISNVMRIRMAQIMLEGELKVGDLAAKVGLSQSATSQHLQKFRKAGLLVQRKDRQWRYCAIEPSQAKVLQRLISLGEMQTMRRARTSIRP